MRAPPELIGDSTLTLAVKAELVTPKIKDVERSRVTFYGEALLPDPDYPPSGGLVEKKGELLELYCWIPTVDARVLLRLIESRTMYLIAWGTRLYYRKGSVRLINVCTERDQELQELLQ